MPTVLGVDFGTTNSVVARIDTGTGASSPIRFATPEGGVETFRSVLCFWTDTVAGRTAHHTEAGPAAVAAYLDAPLDARLVMSTKSYLASRSFTATQLLGRTWTLEQLIARFLERLFAAAGLDPADTHVVAGRPVRFAGDGADDAFGEARLRAAFAAAGLPDITVALEPEAAGHRFAQQLDGPATVLVGDFGGGTSDFSVLRFTPGRAAEALGHAGVGLAGDALDARIMDQVVAPLLGKGSSYAPWGNALPVPAEWYSAFARWHRLSTMRSPRTLRDIADVRRSAAEPARLDHLLQLIEDDQGFALYRAVSATKAALSGAAAATLRFRHGGFAVEREITRAEFEGWIAPELGRMDAAIGAALDDAGHPAIDRVFLTGGTAFVPAVRALFERRFGADRVSGGGEFTSVAEGLATLGAARWGPGPV